MTIPGQRKWHAHVLAIVFVCLAAPATAQQIPTTPPPPETPPAQAETPRAQPVAPDSPLASLRAYLTEANAGQWENAARYLVAGDADPARRSELAERLKGVIDSRRVLDLDAVSRESAGRLDDRLPPDVEDVAVIEHDDNQEPMRLVRVVDDQGAFWAFSAETVGRIDDWYAALPDRWVRDLFAGTSLDFMLQRGFFGLLWWQWVALPFAGLVSWLAGMIFRSIARPLARRLSRMIDNTWVEQIVESVGPSIVLAFAALVFVAVCLLLQIPRDAFAFIGAIARSLMVFAFFWALWRSSHVFVAWSMTRPWAMNNASARSLLSIGSNILRGVIVGLGVLAIIAAVGYPVGTVLAGLGIGGLALAFGAQKTVENVFGSIALATDQPFRIGDFVKVEDFVGTVEDIGLRSTRIRTLDRTVISIPNGKVADQRLESFQLRDRMRLATTVSVTYGTTRSQMETILAGLEHALRSHPRIWPDAVVVKFKELAASSLDIEIMAWFAVPTWGDFQQCRQEVLLEFMRVVEDAGSSFAFPTRTVHVVNDAEARG
jgi:MscS family membrane protein